ncbi:unnamed protein product [Plutella xylostella]|uniref:(diamondback moth) hypothetical protein n=1 Tax=Plutella xylostella TaxID=51655 RepID=A0A8S4FDL0_PLUXY|nr:unnamed protein product [Plutella xylostella]
MANNYNLHSFDGENWESFEQQLECIIALNEVPDSKKVPLLLTKISPKVFETLSCICAPEKPLKLTYIELCNKLRTKYTPLQSSTLDRASFRSRNQFQTETIEEYVLALRKLAGTCKFKDLDDQIKEKLIDGVYSKLIKFELLKGSPDATLDETVVLAKTVEAALAQTKSKNGTEVSDMFQYQQEQRTPSKNLSKRNKFNNSKSQGNKGVNKPQITCYCCGNNNHMKAECRLIHKYCSECGKQGHLYKVCPKNSRTNQIYTMETDDQGSDQSQIQDGVEDSIGGLFDEHIEVYSVNVRKIPPHYIRLQVEGKDLDFQLDTGSDVSVIPLKDKNLFFSKFNILDCNVRFRNFDQTISQPVGIMKDLTVNYENKSMKLNVFIAHDDVPRIIGRDWLDAFDLWPPKFMDTHIIGEEINYNLNVKSVSEAEHVIKEKFAEVFSSGWGDFKGEAIKLKLKSDAKPKCLPARRVPYAMKDKVKNEISRLLENDRITPVEYSQWGTPVVPILKPDGSVRLCGDYKVTLNPHLEVDQYPLPHINDIFNTLKDGKYFCELDLKEAYLQAKLDVDSQELTTIVTEEGTFKYKYLPYGVSTGPGSFQRLMSSKLANIPKTIVFIDNIYIAGKDLNETLNTLYTVLCRLQECQFKLKLEKYNKLRWLPQKPVYNYHHCEFRFWRNTDLKTIPYSLWFHMLRDQQTRSLNIGCLSVPQFQHLLLYGRCRLKLQHNSRVWEVDVECPPHHTNIEERGPTTPPSLLELSMRKTYKMIKDIANKLSEECLSVYSERSYNEENNNDPKNCNGETIVDNNVDITYTSRELNCNVMHRKDRPKAKLKYYAPADVLNEYFDFVPVVLKVDLKTGPVSCCENVKCRKPMFDFVTYEFCLGKIVLIDNVEDVILSAAFCSQSCANVWKGGKTNTIIPWSLSPQYISF